MISKDLRKFWKKIEIETYIIQLNQNKNKKVIAQNFKLENFLSGASQICKIRHLVLLLQCMKQRCVFLTHPVGWHMCTFRIFFWGGGVASRVPWGWRDSYGKTGNFGRMGDKSMFKMYKKAE